MWKQWGPGPVFGYESLLNARRRQVYAGRSLFVLAVLIGMFVVWFTRDTSSINPIFRSASFQQLADFGEWCFYAMAGIQVSLVMLVAPAATAGTICMDRARGTLTHMLMTDLSDVEIVLGKLGARLAPIMALILCSVPVAALMALLGGIDFGAIAGLFVISVSLAILACTLAITISIWATKTHEVLMAVYMIEGVWLLALPLWRTWSGPGMLILPPEWFQKANPFVLAFAPLSNPGFVATSDYVAFSGTILTLSLALAVLSVAKLRRAVITHAGRASKPGTRRPRLKRLFPPWAGPSLDGNPVLWREWHRTQPSRLVWWLWAVLLSITWLLAAWGTYEFIKEGPRNQSRGFAIGLWIQLLFGLLILSATAPTSLAEERVRGSLDLLLTTPLSSSAIVIGKWLGALRCALVLMLLPIYTAIFVVGSMPDVPTWLAQSQDPDVVPLTVGDRIIAVAFCAVDFLVSCALLVSFGILIATWVRRLGRAVALSVTAFFLSGIGLLWLIELAGSYLMRTQSAPGMIQRWLQTCNLSFSPIFGSIAPLSVLERFARQNRVPIWNTMGIVILIKAGIAGGLLLLTIKTFDGRMGRMPEYPFRRRAQRPVVFTELVRATS
jgi:ABC-type transport system involved in multi-copper enzyme maturation permease subunit